MVISAILLGLFIGYLLLILIYQWGWKSIPYYHTEGNGGADTTVSVIIPARNEEANLPVLINSLIKQSYPSNKWDAVIVNDHSTDNTAKVSSSAGGNIKSVNLYELAASTIISYKKKAIETGINYTKGKIILTTDADCKVPPNWVKTVSCFFTERTNLCAVMPVRMQPGKHFLGIFQTLDFLSLQAITAAAVHSKWHSLSNGANLAYLRQTFYEVNGFEKIDHIASGDDMLLTEKITALHPEGVQYILSRDVIVDTLPELTWKSLFNQRIRWAGKFNHFKSKIVRIIMAWVYLFNLMLVLTPVYALWSSFETTYILSVWLTVIIGKTFVEIIFLFPVAAFFEQKSLLKWFPLMQPVHIIYTVLTGLLTIIIRKPEWKGRKIK